MPAANTPHSTLAPADGRHALPIVVTSMMAPVGVTGVQAHFREFRTQLTARGVATELITPFSTSAAIHVPAFAPRRLIEPLSGSAGVWWYFKWHRILLARELRRRLSDGVPAIIYAQSPTAAEAALQARSSPRQVIILAVHFGESVARGWTRRGVIPAGGRVDTDIRRRERETVPRVDGLVQVSADSRRELLEQIPGAAGVPYQIVPNFVDRPPLPTDEPTRDVITLGTLEYNKNQAYLIDVLAEARRLGRDVTATIVGSGPDREDLETRAAARGVSDLIEFAGYVAGGARLIADHRLYVHSSRYESFCIAAAEGLSYGRPVIAGAVGGLPEVYDEGVEGRYWPLDSPQRGAEILLDLLGDEAVYRRMATAARLRFETHFDADVVIPRLYDFLQTIGARRER